jgi:hypothetical protein
MRKWKIQGSDFGLTGRALEDKIDDEYDQEKTTKYYRISLDTYDILVSSVRNDTSPLFEGPPPKRKIFTTITIVNYPPRGAFYNPHDWDSIKDKVDSALPEIEDQFVKFTRKNPNAGSGGGGAGHSAPAGHRPNAWHGGSGRPGNNHGGSGGNQHSGHSQAHQSHADRVYHQQFPAPPSHNIVPHPGNVWHRPAFAPSFPPPSGTRPSRSTGKYIKPTGGCYEVRSVSKFNSKFRTLQFVDTRPETIQTGDSDWWKDISDNLFESFRNIKDVIHRHTTDSKSIYELIDKYDDVNEAYRSIWRKYVEDYISVDENWIDEKKITFEKPTSWLLFYRKGMQDISRIQIPPIIENYFQFIYKKKWSKSKLLTKLDEEMKDAKRKKLKFSLRAKDDEEDKGDWGYLEDTDDTDERRPREIHHVAVISTRKKNNPVTKSPELEKIQKLDELFYETMKSKNLLDTEKMFQQCKQRIDGTTDAALSPYKQMGNFWLKLVIPNVVFCLQRKYSVMDLVLFSENEKSEYAELQKMLEFRLFSFQNQNGKKEYEKMIHVYSSVPLSDKSNPDVENAKKLHIKWKDENEQLWGYVKDLALNKGNLRILLFPSYELRTKTGPVISNQTLREYNYASSVWHYFTNNTEKSKIIVEDTKDLLNTQENAQQLRGPMHPSSKIFLRPRAYQQPRAQDCQSRQSENQSRLLQQVLARLDSLSLV